MSVFYFFNQLPSTNEWALKQERPLPFYCVASQQTAGRGRRANHWCSHQGDLLLSYATLMKNIPTHLSVLCGLQLADFFAKFGINSKLKWPNDLILFTTDNKPIKHTLSESKVGGLLIETKVCRDYTKVVLGIGVNLSIDHIQKVYIKKNGFTYNDILMGVSQILKAVTETPHIDIDFQLWRQYDCLFNQAISFELSEQLPNLAPISHRRSAQEHNFFYRYHAIAQGINAKGELIVCDQKNATQITLKQAFNIRKI